MSHMELTKVGDHGLLGKKMRRELVPREPQVSVVTQTIYASSTSTATSVAIPTKDTPIPLGPIVGGIVGGVVIVLLVVGAWMWWGSRVRAAKLKGAKARRAQDLAAARTGHGKTESTDTLKTLQLRSQSSLSEKSQTKSTHEVKKPSEILSEKPKPKGHQRPPFNHHAPSTTSLASSKYAPSRPSPLAIVAARAPSVMSMNPPTVVVTVPPHDNTGLSPQAIALRSISPLPPAVKVVPPSPPPPARKTLAPDEERTQRQSVQSVQSVQTVASEYSLESPVGMAYGGDETEHEAYVNPREDWRASKNAREPDYFSRR